MESHHLAAIDMLARGLPVDYIAKKLNVTDRTLRRWKVMPDFAEELRLTVELHRFTLRVRHDQIEGKCQTLSDEGLEKIAHVMRTHPDPRICLRAANTLLSHCTRMSARSATLKKADKNGRNDRAVQTEKELQNRTSATDSEEQLESTKPVTQSESMSAPGHSDGSGATGAPTAPPSVHPCPDDSPTQKADENGHRSPETPSKATQTANRPGTDESGKKTPDASVAPHTSLKADINGHENVGATGAPTAVPSVHPCPPDDSPPQKADANGHAAVGAKEQTAVSFAPCCGDSATRSADANDHRSSEKQASSATIRPPQQGGTEDTALGSSLAPTKTPQKADANGHRPVTPSTSTQTADHPGTDESGIRHPDASVAPDASPNADINGRDPELQPPENWEQLNEDPNAHISHEEFIARLTPKDIAQMRVQIGLPNARKLLSCRPDYSQMKPEEIETERSIYEFQCMLNNVLFPELATEYAGAEGNTRESEPRADTACS